MAATQAAAAGKQVQATGWIQAAEHLLSALYFRGIISKNLIGNNINVFFGKTFF